MEETRRRRLSPHLHTLPSNLAGYRARTGRAALQTLPAAAPPAAALMPQHTSAAKRVRQDAKRRLRNRYQKVRVRTLIKELRATTDPAEAATKLNVVKAQLDRLASRRIVHPNNAANAKSQLDVFVRTLAG